MKKSLLLFCIFFFSIAAMQAQTFLWEKYHSFDSISTLESKNILLMSNGDFYANSSSMKNEFIVGASSDGLYRFDHNGNKIWKYYLSGDGENNIIIKRSIFINKENNLCYIKSNTYPLLPSYGDYLMLSIFDSTGKYIKYFRTKDTLYDANNPFLINDDKFECPSHDKFKTYIKIYNDTLKPILRDTLDFQIGFPYFAYIENIQSINDGTINLLVYGDSIALVKLNKNLVTDWISNVIEDNIAIPNVTKILVTSDSGYCLYGYYKLIDTQKVFLWRFNSRGKELWKKVYTLGYYPSKGQAVQIAFPGGFIETYNKSLVFCGYKRIYQGLDSSNDRSLNFLIQTDPNGNELKRFIWGDSSKMNRLSDLVQTSDSNIVVLGSIYDEGKLYLAKIHDLSSDVGNPDISDESSFDVYPNPTTGNINLKLENLNPSFIEVELFDNLGNVISKPYKDYIYNKEFETNFELSGVPQGVYNCVVKAGGRVFSKKVVVVR